MRVAVDAHVASPTFGGFISYIRSLSTALARRDDVDLQLLAPRSHAWALEGLPEEVAGGVVVRLVDLPEAGGGSVGASERWTDGVLPGLLAESPPDVLLCPTFAVPAWRGPRVVTVHDVMWDVFPQWYGERTRRFLTSVTADAVREVDAVLCVSAAARADLLAHYDCRTDPVVTHLAPNLDPALAATSRPLRQPYLLNVGGAHRRKRLDVLVAAFERVVAARSGRDELRLVVVGCAGDERVEELVAQSPVADRIVLTPRVTDAELATWYRHAEAFVYPSEYEGFGLTPLEAAASGVPVVTASSSSLVEVMGDAAVYCSPSDPAALAEAVARVLDDDALRARLVTAGRSRAAGYSWDRTAAETVVVLGAVAG